MSSPSIEYGQLSPVLIVFGAAVAGVLIEAFAPAGRRYVPQLVLSLGALVAALIAVITLAGTRNAAAMGAVIVDGPTLFLQGSILAVAILGTLLLAERRVDPEGDGFAPQPAAVPGSVAELHAVKAGLTTTEVFPLTLFAVGGMLLFPASGDLLTMFVALEVLSLPLYLLCGLARHRRLLSQEAALKYFLLGAFSSAFFLYGVALLYGETGAISFSGIARELGNRDGGETMAAVGLGLIAVGLLFKIGAVPFHSWIPDVYQGAPTSVTAFMAAATKIAAFGALLRLCQVGLPAMRGDWRPMLLAVAALTMVLGSVLAVTQTDVKRMLAYSSVAHAGFILTGVIADTRAGLAATMFYLLAYGVSTLGGFAVVTLLRDPDGEATHLSRWAGLGRRAPVLGVTFSLFLLAFAGIPLTSGFIAKFDVFRAAADTDAGWLVIVGVLCSAVAAAFYIRVIVSMFFADPPTDAPTVAGPNLFTTTVIAACAGATVLLGLFPQPLLDLADHAAIWLP